MSILIKGAEMPKGCEDCSLNYDYYRCEALGDKFDDREEIDMETQRLSDCPLVEIPPHGDLIDVDNLIEDIEELDNKPLKKWLKRFVNGSPVVVESEEE